ncbi:RING-H2 finger protein ATL60-like [Nicotiana tabacum]|uniref:RING-type E3 ubiquitin transferase n=1 Tax=Nicotiana tabacum TaxID=4097 RepID=A0A1S4BDA5_TOBAC|nr:PREDICTED: RING-H2 finger protein ATL3-like [Nicotiana tabacum]
MEDASSSTSNKLDESSALAFLGKIMLGVIIFVFLVVIFIFFLHLYVKWSQNRRRQEADDDSNGGTGRRHKVKVQGLDPSILKTIPVLAFDAKEFKDGTLECTICLCDVTEGEKTRFLPKCNHGFHVDCIDMWFQCHSTCPLCRNAVSTTGDKTPESVESEAEEVEASTELPNFPTNVLYWGNETQVSTLCNPCLDSTASTSNNRTDGMLVIDIPGRIIEEESKSVMPERLRRLMRLLSGDRRAFNPSSSRNVDIEQGGGRSPS